MVLASMNTLDTWIALSSLILALLTVTLSLLVKVTKRITKMEYALFPNNGTSLRDRIDITERKIDLLIAVYETEKNYRD
jgi:hypothetical protein